MDSNTRLSVGVKATFSMVNSGSKLLASEADFCKDKLMRILVLQICLCVIQQGNILFILENKTPIICDPVPQTSGKVGP